ncbi:MAG: recombination-associated protein RdgC [Pseudomonadaceae bacterium]|nr:recombination-associated protein RdgC [Pseudomonadaceae bacterium]
MFRNLRLYRLRSPWPESEEALSHKLLDAQFKPCGPATEVSSGFEPPATGVDLLSRRVAGADLLRLRSQSRVLPAAAINEALEVRVEEYTARTGEPPRRKDRRELKDEVRSQLMSQSFVKSDRIWGMCLPKDELLVVGTASEKQAESFLDALRAALGTLQVTPLVFNKSMAGFMQSVFLSGSSGPFTTGAECKMEDPGNARATVTWMDMDIDSKEVQRHVQDGLKLTRLAVEFDGTLSCVLAEDAVLRKFKLHGLDAMDELPEEDPIAKLDSEFVVYAGAVSRLVKALSTSLDGMV